MQQPNYDRQAKLAQSAGLPELEALSKGANPRLVQPFVALGTLNARMAQMQSDKTLQGAAAPGSIPTLRDKIEQSLQQMKAQAARQQAAQQAQQQAPGMFQVPQGTPTPQQQPQAEEQPVMEARAGGVARLPVNDRMFGYAGGGIIAFRAGERPEDKEGYTGEGPTDADIQAQLDRLDREAGVVRDENGRPRKITAQAPAPVSNMPSPDLASPEAFIAPRGEMRRGAPRVNAGVSQEARPMFPFATAGRNIPGGINTLPMVDQPIERVPATPKPTAAPAPAPAPAPVVGASPEEAAAARAKFAATDPRRVGIAQNIAPRAEPPTIPPTTPPTKPPPPESSSTADMVRRLLMQNQSAGQEAPDETIDQIMAAKDQAVSKMPTTPQELAYAQHLDRMTKRYEANDRAEEEQKAANARNNLATFLMNTRGSSLGIAAGKANEALQPLLASQETRRQAYQKMRDEQEMLMGENRYKLAEAERARKEGRYDDARKYQAEAKKAKLDAAKFKEDIRNNNITAGIALLRNEETVRHHRESMARLASSDAQRALEHKERMAFNEKKFDTSTDLRRQQLMQTNPEYKRAAEELSNLGPALAQATANNKPPPPMIAQRVAELQGIMRRHELSAGITEGAPTAPPAQTGKVYDFNKIGQK